jgi:raffinose/stachyose/melibiose transport system permease protein
MATRKRLSSDARPPWLFYPVIVILLLIWLLPVVMMVMVSLMPPDVRAPAFGGLLMTKFSFYNYNLVVDDVPIVRHFINSFIITIPSVVMVAIFGSMAGFAFSRLRFKGNRVLFSLLLTTLMLPIATLIIPLFQINNSLGLYNTYPALILPYAAIGIPFALVIFRGFFDGFPRSLEDAARMDGCGAGRIYWQIIMPMSGPVVSVVIIWQTMKSWNEFILALVTIDKSILKPLPLVPLIYSGQYMARPGAMFAVLTMMTIPVIIVYVVMQRQIVGGLTSGAVKG